MTHRALLPLVSSIAFACAAPRATDASLRAPIALRCEYGVDPLGVDVREPRLSFELAPRDPNDRALAQSAWQIQVAATRDGLDRASALAWDSGRVASASTNQIPYGGRPLASSERVFWRARAWDQDGRTTGWSDIATWTMGLLSPSDWNASWIGAEDRRGTSPRLGIGWHALEARSLAEKKWVGVDLGRSVRIDRVVLRAVENHGGEAVFGFPPRFAVEVSNDEAFGSSILLFDGTRGDLAPADPATIAIDSHGVHGRYVRVRAKSLWARRDGVGCFALAELEVLSDGENVARGKPVFALDSVEQWGWTKAALTDGWKASPFSTVLLRREVDVVKPIARATAFVCGLGQYEMSIDGAKVGDAWITPGWTQYEKTALYDAYDVTAMLSTGRRCLALVLGNGMYHMEGDTRGAQQPTSRGLPKAIAQIEVVYADGSRGRFVTDASWTVAPGPTTYSGVFGGEDYDARREETGWDRTGFDDSRWKRALVVDGPGGALAGFTHAAPPLKVIETRAPVATSAPKPGVIVVDLGQNAPYVPRLVVRGERGATVRASPAEILRDDGTIDQTTMRAGKRVAYTLAGRGDETYWPRFWYCGSRYWQIEATDASGAAIDPRSILRSFEGLLVHSASAPVGTFECSDELLNRIAALITWAIRSNLASVITDCPHREKSGWLEQIHLCAPMLAYTHDVAQLLRKTVEDCADAQQPDGMVPTMAPEYFVYDGGYRDSVEWGGAFVLLPGLVRRWYGDDALAARHFDAMSRYVDYLGTRAKDGVLSNGLGDWNGYGNDPRTPVSLTDTAYYHLVVSTLASLARDVGRTDDARRLSDLSDSIARAFESAHLDRATGAYAGGSQSSQATALDLGLVPEALHEKAFERLLEDVASHDYAVSCGEVGHPSLLRVLAAHGRSDLVYRIHHQSERPGYGWQLAHGATTLTEAWDASPISHNHFMLGHLLEWLYGDLAGIRPDPDAVGFDRIVIRPRPIEPITWARASYRSIRGPIETRWSRSLGRFTLEASIPPNTTATIYVPAPATAAVYEGELPAVSREGVTPLRMEGDEAVFRVGSGNYTFTVPLR